MIGEACKTYNKLGLLPECGQQLSEKFQAGASGRLGAFYYYCRKPTGEVGNPEQLQRHYYRVRSGIGEGEAFRMAETQGLILLPSYEALTSGAVVMYYGPCPLRAIENITFRPLQETAFDIETRGREVTKVMTRAGPMGDVQIIFSPRREVTSYVLSPPEYYPSVQNLLTDDLASLVEQLIELAIWTTVDYGIPIEHIKVRPSRSVEDPEWQEVIVEFGVDATADEGFSLWDAVSSEIARWKNNLPTEQIELVNRAVSFRVRWP